MSHVTARPPAGDTREMRLTSRLLVGREVEPLSTFIARRRHPGEGWTSWESIAYELRDLLGEQFTRECVRRWAMRYGIPVDTTAEDGPELITAYRETLDSKGVSLT